jgi:hypothetical protein
MASGGMQAAPGILVLIQSTCWKDIGSRRQKAKPRHSARD